MYCLAMGGHLVVINNQEEEHFVKGLTGGKETWIGLSDAQKTGYWFWINSEPLGYTNWCPGEPNNWGGNQHCGMTNYSAQKCWNDIPCDRSYPYVCERN
uniref:C-type lectin domain-containing protein n=1 Tax=Neogobius melanostomus TaxID=47308 RepID=A0A8C6S650_9GOBI